MLYAFSKLSQKLTQLGYPEATESGFRSIRVDFNAETFKKAVRDGKIKFSEDGIYLTYEGKEWKGYMYMPTYRIAKYNSMPRFHLTRCEKIEDLFSSGYGSLYKWSNNKFNDITDRDTYKVYKDEKLQLCHHCQEAIYGIIDTEDFFETLETEEVHEIVDVEVDIFGYTLNWEKISRAYRKDKDYTCEKCGIKIENSYDKRFIHTHHKNGNKLINRKDNLECLCVLCHANSDERHEQNFDKKRMQPELKTFIEKYRQQLTEIGNEYI
jgi:hypothetical protein